MLCLDVPLLIIRNSFFRCGNGHFIARSKVCNLVDDCGDMMDENSEKCTGLGYFGCNFERDDRERWCGFFNESGFYDRKSFNWTMRTGSTPSKGTGPEHDHSLMTAEGESLFTKAVYCLQYV